MNSAPKADVFPSAGDAPGRLSESILRHAAATCCLCELTETSSTHRSKACDIPDFTRGAWRTNKPLGIVDIDLQKMGFTQDRSAHA